MTKSVETMKAHMIFIALCLSMPFASAQTAPSDKRIKQFLDENRDKWHDLNVPYEDGQVLYDIIIKNKYTSALEIGTSTGHSTIWIAWALSKTGGKLITIEINRERHEQALENLKKTGLY